MSSGGTKSRERFNPSKDSPEYFKLAFKDIGVREDKDSSEVEEWIRRVEGKRLNARTTPWCAYWVGAKLEDVGLNSSKSGMARSYLKTGTPIDEDSWEQGDIVIFWRGRSDDNVTGHVGFICSWDDDTVLVLGGNQGDSVSLQTFKRSKVLGVVRPKGLSKSRTIRLATAEGVNEVVVKPVIETAIPEPSKVQETINQTQQAVDQLFPVLGAWKPEIKLVFQIVSMVLICGIIYVRMQDASQKGRT